ncbi:MAG: GDP-mannose 4,6-dehydratase [Candidatus Devosia symbiotica]|nr:GDP-mannose 4,6-dehydratase [Candidatus Devosia symbiotica]
MVTGASGFVGKWTVIELLSAGYSVWGSVRAEAKAESVRQEMLLMLGDELMHRLSFVKIDLMLDNGWMKAMLKVDAIDHITARLATEKPKDTKKGRWSGRGRHRTRAAVCHFGGRSADRANVVDCHDWLWVQPKQRAAHL